MIKADIRIKNPHNLNIYNRKIFFSRKQSRILGLCYDYLKGQVAEVMLTFDDGSKKQIILNGDDV